MLDTENWVTTYEGGRYRNLLLVGEGGMGRVYAAFDATLERPVALKVLRPNLKEARQHGARLRREARLLAQLDHPNVVKILDVCGKKDDLFLVMELLEGETLGERLARERPPAAWCLDVVGQAAEGLAVVHAAGVLHRDVKPGNIFVTRNGPVKLMDFGLARTAERRNVTALTRTGMMVGTLGFMPPEALRGEEVDARGDVFALGATLFVALTGRMPYEVSDLLAVMEGRLAAPRLSVTALAPDAPPDVAALLERALASAPAHRQPDVRTFLEELRPVRMATAFSPSELACQPRRPSVAAAAGAPRPRAAPRALVTAALAVAVAVALAPSELRREEPPPPPTRRAPPATAPRPRLRAGPFVYAWSAGADLDFVVDQRVDDAAVTVDGARLAARGPFPDPRGLRYSVRLAGARASGARVEIPGLSAPCAAWVATGARTAGRAPRTSRPSWEAAAWRNLLPGVPADLRRRLPDAVATEEDRRLLRGVPGAERSWFSAGPLAAGGTIFMGDAAGQVLARPLLTDDDFAVAPSGAAPAPLPTELLVLWRDAAANYGEVSSLVAVGPRAVAYACRADSVQLARSDVIVDAALVEALVPAAGEAVRRRVATSSTRWTDSLVVFDALRPQEAPTFRGAPAAFRSRRTELCATAGGLLALRRTRSRPRETFDLVRWPLPPLGAASAAPEPLRTGLPEAFWASDGPAAGAAWLRCADADATGAPYGVSALDERNPRSAWRFGGPRSSGDAGVAVDPWSGAVVTADEATLWCLDARGRAAKLGRAPGEQDMPAGSFAGDRSLGLAVVAPALGRPTTDGLRFIGVPLPLRQPGALTPSPPQRFLAAVGWPALKSLLGDVLASDFKSESWAVQLAEVDVSGPTALVAPVGPVSGMMVHLRLRGEGRCATDDPLGVQTVGMAVAVVDLTRQGPDLLVLHHEQPLQIRGTALCGNVLYLRCSANMDLEYVAFSPTRLPAASPGAP